MFILLVILYLILGIAFAKVLFVKDVYGTRYEFDGNPGLVMMVIVFWIVFFLVLVVGGPIYRWITK